jgi:hypothetical protein
MRPIIPILFALSALPKTARAQAVAPPPRGRAILVHVDGERDVFLQQKRGDDWYDICDVPCNRWLPASGDYRVAGPNVRESAPFALTAASSGKETVTIHASSAGQYFWGTVLVGVGSVAILTGTGLAAIGASWKTCKAADVNGGAGDSCSLNNPQLVGVGIAVAAVGAVALISGVITMVSTNRSSVSQTIALQRAGVSVATLGTFKMSTLVPVALLGQHTNLNPENDGFSRRFELKGFSPLLTIKF